MQAFKDVPRTVWLLAGGVFFNSLVSVTFVYLFLYLTGPRGLGIGEAGVISGIGGVGVVLGNFTGGWFGDRFGHRRVLVVAATVAGVLLAALPVLPTAALYVTLPLSEYATGVVRAANSALVAVIVPEGSRRQAFAVIRAAGNGGFTIGPPLGALVATQISYDWLFVADGLGTLFFACWTARVVPARGATRANGAGTGGLWPELRARPAVLVLLAAILVIDLVYRQQYSTFPLFLADHGMDARVYGALLAVNGGVILCLELPAALALRRRSPLAIVGTGLLLVAAGYAALMLGAGLGTAIAMMALLTLGEVLYKTTATAYVADQAPAHVQGRFQSLYAGASISGMVLAAPLGGALYQAAPGALWPVCAALGALAGVAVLGAGLKRGGELGAPGNVRNDIPDDVPNDVPKDVPNDVPNGTAADARPTR
ncbi:MFS transporter [Streptomyces sp. PSKA28]|uniref:MFS transporter n=1 Tax=Streptomyces himalayensis subsp. himalayensis TaxID=2756131 RepID=A0A7W0DNI2_9ACTN|nr:MFS transporter [Streptomyces himalayensis]MBA2948344.1 MFS transporter [Streptomyces himalayensis subsp. himalayensis]